jgi:hypothetical protein
MTSPMTSPLDRSSGSAQILRYRGRVAPATIGQTPVPLATFPKPNCSFPSDTQVVTPLLPSPAPPSPLADLPYFVAYARFALFDPGPVPGVLDPAALANFQRRFPAYVYDSGQPAGVSPVAPLPALNDPGLNDGELLLNASTWAQNIQVRSSNVDLNVIGQDIGMLTGANAAFFSSGVAVVRDTLSGGLGLNTGLPVIVVPFLVLAQSNGQLDPTFAIQSFSVDLTIEIPQSIVR